MFLAVQYYRPPFPERRFWHDDLAAIRDAGLDGIQLWCIWGWIEHEAGTYDYGDYDEIVAAADRLGLKVVLSTIAEVQPFWIHRVVPGAELVDHTGRATVSCPRAEVNVGLTPGGCFDHPEIADRMRRFLADIAGRYARAGNVYGWDCWNETRWNVHADGLTCYCAHTLAAFRRWLADRYGGLAGLNAAWKRRYAAWADVRPSKRVGGPFCDMIDFARYQSWRTTQHCRFRYEALRAGGAAGPITAHGPMPTIHTPPVLPECPLCRGNDWEMADVLDGVGSSTFPISEQMAPEYVATRFQEVASAAQGKVLWFSELQGSSAAIGYRGRGGVRRSPLHQRRWALDLLSRNYQAVIFWQWRDERFCREAGTGGLAGRDGQAAGRIEGMRRTAALLRRQADLLADYRPDRPRVGVLFNPHNYYLAWAMTGEVWDVMHSVVGYAMALERLRIPYEFVECEHLDVLDGLDVLLMPFCQILPDSTRAAVLEFLRRGGRVLVEAEADAYDAAGFYREPPERPFASAIGVGDLGRRPLPDGEAAAVQLASGPASVPLRHFVTPLSADGAEALARDADGEPLLCRRGVGRGAVFALGGFAGKPYFDQRSAGLEALVAHICRDAGIASPFEFRTDEAGESCLCWRAGTAAGRRVLFLFNGREQAAVRAAVADRVGDFGGAGAAAELTGDKEVPIDGGTRPRSLAVDLAPLEAAVLSWPTET